MPDWSYQPLFRPVLDRMSAGDAHRTVLRALGGLGAHSFGPALIALFGHTRPARSLRRNVWGITFPGPVGLAAGLDPAAEALPALARFGVGFVEVGPVTLEPVVAASEPERLFERAAIAIPEPWANPGVAALLKRLVAAGEQPVPIGARLAHRPGADALEAADERCTLIRRLAPAVDFFVLETNAVGTGGWSPEEWQTHLQHIHEFAASFPMPRPLLVCVSPERAAEELELLLEPAIALGITGVVVAGGVATDTGQLSGMPARAGSLAMVQTLEQRWGEQITLIGSGGIHTPQHALELLEAGATLVMVGSGLGYAGPGLPKRINEAISAIEPQPGVMPARPQKTSSQQFAGLLQTPWIWIALFGIGMLIGGALAWLIALTRVVLPYDEAFVGLDREALAALNPRLFPFMIHNRVTLAGTMLAIGVLYLQLAWCALRYGEHWAKITIGVSAGVGFVSFFLFLGFGYLDPLHLFVTALLWPLFLLGMHGRASASPRVLVPDLQNDRRWFLAQHGQLLLIGLGIGLIAAGAGIAAIGISTMFVAEDLAYLGMEYAVLREVAPNLVPLIAHDRAGLGGALISTGLAVLLSGMWGVRRGARWVWWMLLISGIPGFGATIWVHLAVGYVDLFHLAPVVVGASVYALALLLLGPYLLDYEPGSRRMIQNGKPITHY